MTLARAPLTFPNAITRIAAVLGFDGMAGIIGRSQRLVRKWSHPQARAYPTLAQAVALDAAYAAAGGDGAPLLETYSQLLDMEIGRQAASRIALNASIATAARECGEAVAHGLAVGQPGSGAREVHRAIAEAEQAHTAMAVVVRRLSNFLTGSAGLPAENGGGAP
jgi:hypothetical protein